jgi:acyl-coenzyme A synthetase/AMP-(fatty) acid ligase
MTQTTQSQTVLKYVKLLCEVLRIRYQTYAIQSHRNLIEKGKNVEYHQQQIDALSEGEGVDEYVFEKGKKYFRIFHISNSGGSKSVHMFVNMITGDCFKPASYNAPAKGIRYNLLDDYSREELLRRADWSGGYLYADKCPQRMSFMKVYA